MKKTLLLLFCLSVEICFGQCNDVILKMLKGTWVRDKQPADTIRFAPTLESDYRFQLIPTNFPKPQAGPAGLYEFRTLGTTMLVRWLPSSSSGAEAIPFFIDKGGRSLTLGNFYRSPNGGKLFTFRKVN